MAVLSAIKGTYGALGSELVTDLKGSTGNIGFIYWVSSIVVVGAVGYYSPAQRFSRAFLFLILLGMVIANQSGLFARVQSALQNPKEPQSQPLTGQNVTPGQQSQQTSALSTGTQSLTTATTALESASVLLV